MAGWWFEGTFAEDWNSLVTDSVSNDPKIEVDLTPINAAGGVGTQVCPNDACTAAST